MSSYYSKDRNKSLKKANLYYKQNPQIKEREKLYYLENKDKIQAYHRSYWLDHGHK
jgi:hypothetical protein